MNRHIRKLDQLKINTIDYTLQSLAAVQKKQNFLPMQFKIWSFILNYILHDSITFKATEMSDLDAVLVIDN